MGDSILQAVIDRTFANGRPFLRRLFGAPADAVEVEAELNRVADVTISTVSSNGRPHAAPTNCAAHDGSIYFTATDGSKLAANLSRDPAVAFRCGSVVGAGDAQRVCACGAPTVAARALVQPCERVQASGYEGALWRIEPTRIVASRVAPGRSLVDGGALAAIQARSFDAASKVARESYPPPARLDAAGLARFLSDKRYMTLATCRQDGTAHATMTSFVVSGSAFWVANLAGAVRTGNLERSGSAAIVVTENEGDAHTAVTVDASAHGQPTPPAAVAEAYRARFGSDLAWVAQWFELRPRRLLSFAGVASPYRSSPG